jgi:hypothetical protein
MRRGVGARLGAAVAVLVVVALGAADAGLSINSSAPPAPHADDLLSKAERVASKAESFVKANQRLLSAVGGSVLLLHGQVRTRQAKRDDRVPLRVRHFLLGRRATGMLASVGALAIPLCAQCHRTGRRSLAIPARVSAYAYIHVCLAGVFDVDSLHAELSERRAAHRYPRVSNLLLSSCPMAVCRGLCA